ncbi:MAG: hypothetical protein Q9160_007321 [Pyrenula sp. 1 TL-2023]
MAGPQRARTTISLTGLDLFKHTTSSSARTSLSDTIYYLINSVPHIHEFSYLGPFRDLESVAPPIHSRLREQSPAGLITFNEMISEIGLSAFDHINAPLPGPGDHKVLIQLIKETNPEVRAVLPGPSWMVVTSEPLNSTAAEPFATLKDQEIHGTYVSAQGAERRARELVADTLSAKQGSRAMEMPHPEGAGKVHLIVSARSEPVLCVEARRENGNFIAPPGSRR